MKVRFPQIALAAAALASGFAAGPLFAQTATAPSIAPPLAAPPVDPLAAHPGLEALDPDRPRLGVVGQPSPETRDRYKQFVQAIADPDNTLDLVAGTPRILLLKQAPFRIQIPDETIASYDVLSDKEVSINGKAVGTTVLNLWFNDPQAPDGHRLLSYLVRVFPDPQAAARLNRVYSALEDQINKTFPDSKVTLLPVADNVLVRGTARDAAEASEILHILQLSIPGAVVDIPFDTTEQPPANPQDAVVPTVRNFLNSGSLHPNAANAANGKTRLVNLLRIQGTNQVMLRVTVAEVNRSAARSIGLNFAIKDAAGQVIFQNTTGGLASFSAGSSAAGLGSINTGANIPMIFDGGQVAVALNALRTLNLAKSLAEPNLVAVDGHSATFQAGGEFPVPVVTGATATGLQSVQFIPFGVQLNFTPFLPEKDRIRLNVAASVSTRDNADSAIIGNTSVPSINSRNFQTTVDLKPGQTFAVAGLIQQNSASNTSHIPGIGDLPILANLLGSSTTSSAEQELVILVNAELVQPLDKPELPALPGYDIIDPSDIEFFIRGRLESRYPQSSRPALQTDWDRMVKYQEIQKQLIIGPSGYSDDRLPTTQSATPSATQGAP